MSIVSSLFRFAFVILRFLKDVTLSFSRLSRILGSKPQEEMENIQKGPHSSPPISFPRASALSSASLRKSPPILPLKEEGRGGDSGMRNQIKGLVSLCEADVSTSQMPGSRWAALVNVSLIGIFLWTTAGCAPQTRKPLPAETSPQNLDQSLSFILAPNPEDIPFFQAIVVEQDKRLQRCPNDEECVDIHFLRAVASLYIDQERAAHHFRRVVAAKPNSQLASESRFWLWVLEVLNSPSKSSPSSEELAKRFAREMVDRELMVQELVSKLNNSSVEALQQNLNDREKKIEEQNLMISGLTKQMDQLKKEVAARQGLQQELQTSEKKVQELVSQLEALRRIDQELKEKTPPTRPSEKMAPAPEMETETIQENTKPNGG